MTWTNPDWTHRNISIVDIRKLNKLYVIKINDPTATNQIESALFVSDVIFEERLKSYFLKEILKITREDILSVKWNMYITRGYFIKVNEKGDIEKMTKNPEKWYVSYLEIDGPLGSFESIYHEKELNKQ